MMNRYLQIMYKIFKGESNEEVYSKETELQGNIDIVN